MYRIMIIDDEITSQEMIHNYIRTQLPMYKVTSICQNGKEALETFLRCPADILLVDIRMPIMDGLTFIEKLNDISTNVVPIIISSYGDFSYAQTAMRLGIVHYLLKPLDFHELSHALYAASQTLNFKRISYNPLSLSDDNQELYLHNILKGMYKDKETALDDFSELAFPFSYDKNKGLYIRIDFHNVEKWIYGWDTLLTALTNLIRMLYSPVFVISTFRRKNGCDYLFVCGDIIPMDFIALNEQVQQLLNITISAHSTHSFSSIEQLRINALDMCDVVTIDGFEEKERLDNTVLKTSIENAIAYMQEHYAEDLTRDHVAEKVYMSGAHFSRCFKLITSVSYKDYLTEIRMQKAIELLKTNARISDIAQKVGYNNPNRFNVNFRHYTSYTPSEYRTYVLKML